MLQVAKQKPEISFLGMQMHNEKTRGDNKRKTSHLWSQQKTPPLFDEGFMLKTSVTHTGWWQHSR